VNLPLPGSVTAQHEHRRRHRDMLVNSESLRRLQMRSHIISWLRRYLDNMGFLEVETPILSLRCGGAMATPFSTASDPPLFLRIAPELYLKKLVVGGLDAVYEIGKQFRNEGVDKTHVNEFTTIELYRANWDYEVLMSFTEQLLYDMNSQFGGLAALSRPFRRMPVVPSINEAAKCSLPETDLDERSLPLLIELCRAHNLPVGSPPTVGRCIDKVSGFFLFFFFFFFFFFFVWLVAATKVCGAADYKSNIFGRSSSCHVAAGKRTPNKRSVCGRTI
jgi:lysyl-tRNA synthetase class 2